MTAAISGCSVEQRSSGNGGQQNSHETTIAARRTGSWNADGAAGARSNDYRKACLRGEPNGESSTTDEGIPGVHGPLLARLLLRPSGGIMRVEDATSPTGTAPAPPCDTISRPGFGSRMYRRIEVRAQ